MDEGESTWGSNWRSGLPYEGVCWSQWKPIDYKIVASTGFGENNNTFCRNLRSTEIYKMEILSFL